MSLVTEKGGIKQGATEEFINAIKMLYRALKERKLFYTFQQNYYPLEGLCEDECRGDLLIGGNSGIRSDGLMFGDIEVSFPRRADNIGMYNKSSFWKSVCILFSMIRQRPRMFDMSEKELRYGDKVCKKELLRMYAETYFKQYKRTHNVPRNMLAYCFVFGIIFMIISILAFSFFVYLTSPKILAILLTAYTGLLLAYFIHFKVLKPKI